MGRDWKTATPTNWQKGMLYRIAVYVLTSLIQYYPRMANTLFTIRCSFQKVLEHSDQVLPVCHQSSHSL